MSKHAVRNLSKARLVGLAALLGALCSSGCQYFRSASAPIPHVAYRSPGGDAETLVVLLPGIDSRAADFAENGWVDRIHAAAPRADVIAVDAHFGYYRTESLLTRLQEDVLRPLQHAYEQVWIVGVSLGGLGAALYAAAHPGEVDGMLLLAPYTGRPAIFEEVLVAGGLDRWDPPSKTDLNPEQRAYVTAWELFQRAARDERGAPQLYLGFGAEDGFRVPNGVLASALPQQRCFTQPGGHTWSVWTPLFERMLAAAVADAR